MFIRRIIILTLLLQIFSQTFSQTTSGKAFIKSMEDADLAFYYDEDFYKAASLYEVLLKSHPENSNISAKLGMCYLNIDGKQKDALRLLETAVLNVVKNDNEYIEYGEKAPIDTYFYLAEAFHLNDSLQKAISLYNEAKKKLGGSTLFRKDYIDAQIRNCKYAIEMEMQPYGITKNLFTPWLINYPGACNGVVSENDSVFIFTEKEGNKTRIFYSKKTSSWNEPIDITNQLGGFDRFYSNSITRDGRLLILYLEDGGDGNLYYSQLEGSKWSKIKSLGRNINSIYWESHGYITNDGKGIYFASNRPGGEGDLDIWFSEKDEKGSWKRPVNCGKVINTPFNENYPFFDSATSTLIFSSMGHVSMGNYDVFRSTLNKGKWTKPVGLPYPINTTGENVFFISKDNSQLLITSLFDDKDNTRNIYTIEPLKPAENLIITQGNVTLQDGMGVDPAQMKVILIDQKTGEILKNLSGPDTASIKVTMKPGDLKVVISRIGNKTDTINLNIKKKSDIAQNQVSDTATFRYNVKPGIYRLFVNYPGYKTDSIDLTIPSVFSGNYVSVNSSLVPEKVYNGDFLMIKNILFEYNSYSLNNDAKSLLEVLKHILINYPDLKIEIGGYTDSKGSVSYNLNLSDKRAQAVINYLSDSEISGSRFVKKIYGITGAIANNTKPDGSDNPEGRKYNRRVSFGIINPQTGITVYQENYVPEHLRQHNSIKFSIVLIKSANTLNPEYFKNLNLNEYLLIKSVRIDSLSQNIYTIGNFYDKTEASKYLTYLKGIGFPDSYIVNQYELNGSNNSVVRNIKYDETKNDDLYTIQLAASKNKLPMNRFSTVPGVKEIASSDGYYRYIYGEFKTYLQAKSALNSIREAGFNQAYIRKLDFQIINK
jgi:outer membrane protein OmpA-like peptidoglycan-associated protein